MNAVNALFREQQEAELAAAVAAANRWTEIARPLIQASIDLERFAYDATAPLAKLEGDKSFEFLCEDALNEARRLIEKAAGELDPIICGLRDNFLADHSKSWSNALSEVEGDAVDAFNEALAEEVVSVKDFIAQAEREDRDRFLGRAA